MYTTCDVNSITLHVHCKSPKVSLGVIFMYSGARIIRTKIRLNFVGIKQNCVNHPYIEVYGVNGEAYNCANNDCANYLECANDRGSNYPSSTVQAWVHKFTLHAHGIYN